MTTLEIFKRVCDEMAQGRGKTTRNLELTNGALLSTTIIGFQPNPNLSNSIITILDSQTGVITEIALSQIASIN